MEMPIRDLIQKIEPKLSYKLDGIKFLDVQRVPEFNCPDMLMQELHRTYPAQKDLFDTVEAGIPFWGGNERDTGLQLYKLPKHVRSYYLHLGGAEKASFYTSIISVKGLDVISDNFDDTLSWMSLTPFRDRTISLVDHFPINEGKLPGAVTLKEVEQEVSVSHAVHAKHLNVFGTLAHIPLPLYVHQLSKPESSHYFAEIMKYLSEPAKLRVLECINQDLFAIVSFYPTTPLRADSYDQAGKEYMLEHFGAIPSIKDTISKWIDLILRLLLLGFMPTTPWSARTGSCLDPGNACLDGGFSDADSIVNFENIKDDSFFFTSLAASLHTFFETTSVLLQEFINGSSTNYISLMLYISSSFLDQLNAFEARGLILDDRIIKYLRPRNMYDLLGTLTGHSDLKSLTEKLQQ